MSLLRRLTGFSAMVAILLVGGFLIGGNLLSRADANSDHQFTLETVPILPDDGTVPNGNDITYRARVNTNGAAAQNVKVVFVATNAVFDIIPRLCKTSGVTPISAISNNGHTLTCNTGDWGQGSSFRIDVSARANGMNGATASLVATQSSDGKGSISQNGTNKIITADFKSDIGIYGGVHYAYNVGVSNDFMTEGGGRAFPVFWRVALAEGSEAVNSDSFEVAVTLSDYQHPDQAGFNGLYAFAPAGSSSCTALTAANRDVPFQNSHYDYERNPLNAAFSKGGAYNSNTNSGSCTFTGSGDTYELSVQNMDTSMSHNPSTSAWGKALPINEVQYASGVFYIWVPQSWLDLGTPRSSSLKVNVSGYDVYGLSGQPNNNGDYPEDNSQTFTFTPPGDWSARWDSEPNWGATHKYTPGETVGIVFDRFVNPSQGSNIYNDGEREISCTTIGSGYSFDSIGSYFTNSAEYPSTPVNNSFITFQYSTAALTMDPALEDCGDGDGSWVTFDASTPLSAGTKAAITKIRAVWYRNFSGWVYWGQLYNVKIDYGLPLGYQLWTFNTRNYNGWWYHTADVNDPSDTSGCITPTVGKQYVCTNPNHDYAEILAVRSTVTKNTSNGVNTYAVGDTVPYVIHAVTQGQDNATVTIIDKLPSGMSLVPGSAKVNGSPFAPSVSGDVLTWNIVGVNPNVAYDITYDAVINSGTSLNNTTVIEVRDATGANILDNRPEAQRTASKTVNVYSDGSVLTSKLVNKPRIDAADNIVFTVNMKNQDATTHAYTDVIDVLPYNGDGRTPASSFHGTVGNSSQLNVTTNQAGATICYSTASPATISLDPTNASNGTAGNAASCNSGIWTTTKPASGITAIRSIGGAWALADGDINVNVTIARNGWKHWDIFTNKAGTVAGDTQLKMISNDVTTQLIAPFVPNIVKDIEYNETDTIGNSAADRNGASPKVIRVGDDFYYTITITNIGDNHNLPSQGTIRITDTIPTEVTYAGEITIKNNAGSSTGTCSVAGQVVTCESDYELPVNSADALNIRVKVHTPSAPIDNIINTAKVEGGVCIGNINTIAGNACESDVSNKCPIGNDLAVCKESETSNFRTPELHIEKAAYSLANTGGIDIGDYGYFTIRVTNEGNIETRGTVTVKDPIPTQYVVYDDTVKGPWGAMVTLPWSWPSECSLDGPTNVVTCELTSKLNDITLGGGGAEIPSSATTGAVNYWEFKIPVQFDPDPTDPADIFNRAYVGGGNDQTCLTADLVESELENSAAYARCADDSQFSIRPRLQIVNDYQQNGVHIDEARYDSTFEYTLVVRNVGEVPTNIRSSIEDWIPAELEMVPGSPIIETGSRNPGLQYCNFDEADNQHLICDNIIGAGFQPDNPNRPGGDEVTVTVTLRPKINYGEVEDIGNTWGDDHDCPNIVGAAGTMRCHHLAKLNIVSPELNIEKVALDSLGGVEITETPYGSSFLYQLTVTNSGTTHTDYASTVTDILPAGIELDTSLPFAYAGTADDANGNYCNLTTTVNPIIGSGETDVINCVDVVPAGFDTSDTVTISFWVKPGLPKGEYENFAYIFGDDYACQALSDATIEANARCTDSASVKVISPMLKIEKTANITSYSPSQIFSYHISVTNVGDYETIAQAQITDSIPSGLTVQSVTPVEKLIDPDDPSLGTFDFDCTNVDNDVECTIGAGLAIGDSVELDVKVQASAQASGTLVNTAYVTGGGDMTCVADPDDRIITGDIAYDDSSRCYNTAAVAKYVYNPEIPGVPNTGAQTATNIAVIIVLMVVNALGLVGLKRRLSRLS